MVLIGVSGVGKTTVGRAVADRLGWAFVDADDLQPPANVAKMRSGHPLDDADRAPWLAAVHRALVQHRRSGTPVVLACSALKATYRAVIAGDLPEVRFVHLAADPAVIAERMRHRDEHFMPVSLLASQLRTFEDSPAVPTVAVDAPVEEVVARVVALVTPVPADGNGADNG